MENQVLGDGEFHIFMRQVFIYTKVRIRTYDGDKNKETGIRLYFNA